jgi:hypothetical protein
LLRGGVTLGDLRAVERRRMLPTRFTQALQVFLQDRVVQPVLHSDRPIEAPLPLRLASRFRFLRAVPAYVIGIGIRPEHVRTPSRT